MERFELTPEECLVVELLFISVDCNNTDLLSQYYQLPCEKTGLREILINLQEKGVILKSCKIPEKGKKFDPEVIEFNQNFIKYYGKTSGELGEELFNAYPNEAIIQGQAVPLRNYAKKYKDFAEFAFQYGKAIGWNRDKHAKVLELIQWSKNNDHFGLNMNLCDFVGSKMWISIEDHKDGSNAITFDNLTSI